MSAICSFNCVLSCPENIFEIFSLIFRRILSFKKKPMNTPVDDSELDAHTLSTQLYDNQHILHPYSSLSGLPLPVVEKAHGAELFIKPPQRFGMPSRWVIDGMSSWWAAIHGYNHPLLNRAATEQIQNFSHVMFGGLTHEPAVNLTRTLLKILPAGLDTIFYSDSGSVAVEVALKMARQYWICQRKPEKNLIMTWKGGYHGDTFETMSVCDPHTGMHQNWGKQLHAQIFTAPPPEILTKEYVTELETIFSARHHEIAAMIIEPIVQGAGGMRFHAPEVVHLIRQLCTKYNIVMIADEIATGFARTGTLFACDHAGIVPDIMCLGKALTGGYVSFAATVTTREIAESFSRPPFGAFCHGPTFMANPLACAISSANLDLLMSYDYEKTIESISDTVTGLLEPISAHPRVKEVRTRGAIAVIECQHPIDMEKAARTSLSAGVWLRPFNNLIYAMPPYITTYSQLEQLCHAMMLTVQEQ